MFDNRLPERSDEYYQRKIDKRKERILRDAKEPMLPGFSTLFFVFTTAGTAFSAVSELAHYLKFPAGGFRSCVRNMSVTMFAVWGVCGALTVILSLLRYIQLKKDPSCALRRRPDESIERGRPDYRKREETKERYTRRIVICLIGAVIFGGLYFIFR